MLEFHVAKPGPFEFDAFFVVDDSGLRFIPVHGHGVGQPAKQP